MIQCHAQREVHLTLIISYPVCLKITMRVGDKILLAERNTIGAWGNASEIFNGSGTSQNILASRQK